MNIFERPVNICINKDLDVNKRHGIIWISSEKSVEKIPFILDRPSLVKKGLNPSTYTRIVRQIKQMGYKPYSIELCLNGMVHVYDGQQYRNKISLPESFLNTPVQVNDMVLS